MRRIRSVPLVSGRPRSMRTALNGWAERRSKVSAAEAARSDSNPPYSMVACSRCWTAGSSSTSKMVLVILPRCPPIASGADPDRTPPCYERQYRLLLKLAVRCFDICQNSRLRTQIFSFPKRSSGPQERGGSWLRRSSDSYSRLRISAVGQSDCLVMILAVFRPAPRLLRVRHRMPGHRARRTRTGRRQR